MRNVTGVQQAKTLHQETRGRTYAVESLAQQRAAFRSLCLFRPLMVQRGLMVVCLWFLFLGQGHSEVRSLVVLPFTNLSKNPGISWLSECFPELLEERLRWISLNVLGRDERMIAVDRIGIAYSPNLSKATLIKIGQELDAQILILGEFSSDGNKIEVSLSHLNLQKNNLSLPMKEAGPLEEIQLLSGRLAWKLLTQLDDSFQLTLESYLAQFPPIPNLALENYVRGLIESSQSRQIRLYRQAEREYPSYAKPIFQLGKLYHQQRDYSTSNLWFQKLIKLNDSYLEAHFLEGLNFLYLKKYDHAAEEFQRLKETLPLGQIATNLGIALSLKGSKESATAALKQAVEIEPTEPDYSFNLAYHHWRTGDFGAAVKSLDRVIEATESDGEAYYLLFKCLQALGKSNESAMAWDEARQWNPKVENWETRKEVPDLFRVQTQFDESSFNQLQLQLKQIEERKKDQRTIKDRAGEFNEQTKGSQTADKFDKVE